MGWGKSGFNCGVGQGAYFVLFLLYVNVCGMNVPAVSLVLPAFDDTSSLGAPPRRVVYPRSYTLTDCFPFPCGR